MCLQVTSFQAKAVEVGSKMEFDRRLTEWLQERLLPAVRVLWPRMAPRCRYWIHNRELLKVRLGKLILGFALLLNAVAAVFHNDLSSELWERVIINALGWAIVGLTAFNFAIRAFCSGFTIQQKGWIVRSLLTRGARGCAHGQQQGAVGLGIGRRLCKV